MQLSISALWRKATVTLLLLATSTILYAAKPVKPDNGERSAACTFSPAGNTITKGRTITVGGN